jgi:ribosomal protein L35
MALDTSQADRRFKSDGSGSGGITRYQQPRRHLVAHGELETVAAIALAG